MKLATLTLLALALTACSAEDDGAATEPTKVVQKSPAATSTGIVQSAAPHHSQATLGAGTSWNVVAINGRPTAGPDFYLQLTKQVLSAKFGCNAMGGHYALNGDHLSVASLEQDAKMCSGPAGEFEAQGSALLRSNMRIEQVDADRVRLVSEAGTIDLIAAT